MTKNNQIYKCNICGNVVGVLHSGVGELVCCGQPMELLKEIAEDKGLEKHVPVFQTINNRIEVKVGSTLHPMEEDHYIEWIEVIFEDNRRIRKFLEPGDKPVAQFCSEDKVKKVRIYCNIHGLWKTE